MHLQNSAISPVEGATIRETLRFAIGETPLGGVLIAASETGICALFFGDSPAELVGHLEDRFPTASIRPGGTELQNHLAQINRLIENPSLTHNLPLDLRGTSFQQQVWTALTKIPLGQTDTYSGIAAKIGRPKAVRAVAAACANNKIALLIPCHRVIATTGKLTGYRWGLNRKRMLLEREKAGSGVIW